MQTRQDESESANGLPAKAGAVRVAGSLRVALAGVVIVAHLLAFMWLARTPTPVAPNDPPTLTVALARPGEAERPSASEPPAPTELSPSVPADVAAAPSETPSAIAPPAPSVEPTSARPSTLGDEAANSSGTPAQACAVVEQVQADLIAKAEARAAVGRIPTASLSVAHALLLWDGRWAEPGSVGGSTVLEPIRRVILTRLARTPPACLHEPVSGPRLLILSRPEGTTVLAIGSGVWTWSGLLTLTQ